MTKLSKFNAQPIRSLILPFALSMFCIFLITSCTKDETSLEVPELADEIEKRQDEIPGFTFSDPCTVFNVYVDPNCSDTEYENAIHSAIDEFSNAPINVGFTIVEDEEEADLVISCPSSPNSACGEARWLPTNGLQTVGSNIELFVDWGHCLCTNGSCNDVGFVPDCMFTRTVMHELMHALGLHHNGSGTHIVGTPDTDYEPGSVINSGPLTNVNCDWCTAPCEFSAGDIAALQILYTEPETEFWCVCFLEDYYGNYQYYEEQIECGEDCDQIEDRGNIGNYLIEYCDLELR